MKVLALQNHSKNNQKLYNLTIQNHIDYFNKYQIDFLTKIEDYTPYVRFETIFNMIGGYDFVFTIGSDCLFTNFDKYILDFIDKDKNLNICREGSELSLTNGQIMFFRNGSQDFIAWLHRYQHNINHPFGFQGFLNWLYDMEKQFFLENIHLIQPKTLQSYFALGGEYQWRKANIKNWDELTWINGDFILHTLGGSNEYKYNTIKFAMENLIK